MSKTKDEQKSGTPQPKGTAQDTPLDRTDGELSAEELQQVDGGIGLLLPAVQKVREAVAQPSGLPEESISLNYAKITKK